VSSLAAVPRVVKEWEPLLNCSASFQAAPGVSGCLLGQKRDGLLWI